MLKQKLGKYKLILGSKSPRRQMLLKGLDVDFEVKTIEVDETYPKEMPPEGVPVYLAMKKAQAFGKIFQPGWLLITADTVVILDGQIIGKPHTRDRAEQMLRQLSGKKHSVVTGVCLRTKDRERVFSCKTDVWFKPLTDEEITYYLDNYSPLDKAGAYGVQEWIGYIGVERIDGSYYNVVGLPVQRLYTELMKFLEEGEV